MADRDASPAPTTRHAVPARVLSAIRKREEESEILIGWVQLSVVMTFATLYAVTPHPSDGAATMFEPVPTALAIYFSFTVIRLILSYTRMTPAWFLYLSIFVDVGLLLGLIWSFHIQYAQPPSFYLKAPTVMYIFIFITVRALRFDATYVIAAGVAAVAGWLGMLAYAVTHDPAPDPITRDYIAYMTGNRILLGAEIDKIITILVVTGILAAALVRARRLLVAAVTESTAASDLKRFFSPEVARAITGAEMEVAAGHGEMRDAAILMVDIRGFSRRSESLSADAVVALLGDYQMRVGPIIRRHGGAIDKYLGDGIMAIFGTGDRANTYAADALRALDDITGEMAGWSAAVSGDVSSPPLRVNGAVATGRVVFGAVGDAQRLEFTVIGSAVNLAAKLEKHNKAVGAVALTTRTTFDLAQHQGYVPTGAADTLSDACVEGLAEPTDLVVLARPT